MNLITHSTQLGYYLYNLEEILLLLVVCWGGPSASTPGEIIIKMDAHEVSEYERSGSNFLASLAKSIQYSIDTERVKKGEYWTYEFSHSRDVKDEEAISLAFTEYKKNAKK